MPEKTALIYASVDGHTLKICEKLKQVLLEHNQPVEIINIEDFNGDLTGFGKVVLGASIRYGVHHKKIIELINSRTQELETKKNCLFLGKPRRPES